MAEKKKRAVKKKTAKKTKEEPEVKKPEAPKEESKSTSRRVITVCQGCDDKLGVIQGRSVIASVDAATCDYCHSVKPCKKFEA